MVVNTVRKPVDSPRDRAGVLQIDGAHGEGGGQLVRTAVAVAAATGVPIRIVNIRALRRAPGLAAQHAAAVRAVAALCDAECDGVRLHSPALRFLPQRLHGGEFEIDVGTAGSIALVLQALLPAAVASGERVVATIRGGTDVRAAPPVDYVRLVLLPLLETMGVRAELSVARRGYYPRGGGVVRLALEPTARLRPFAVAQAGPVARIEAHVHVAHLPQQIAERMAGAARAELPAAERFDATVEVCDPELVSSPGGAIVLRAVTARTVLGAAQIAQRGVPAEQLGQAAGRMLKADLQAGATLDVHASDQLLVFLALADGPSQFRASQLTAHASTAMWLLEQLTSARFGVQPTPAGMLVHAQP
ncbi:MAG TPA: RNA 3'-terminal phosphate cyclase [Ramlibacter sp.]|nr:RNA 3'-terminal phosphate cyclase [Ramlibacter sp.]